MKKGQANIIVTVLIVFIVIVAFAIVFNIVKPLVSEKSSEIETGITRLQLPYLQAKSLIKNPDGSIDVKVDAGSGKGIITKARFTFTTDSGDCFVTKDVNIKALETKTININVSGCGEVSSVSNIEPVDWIIEETVGVVEETCYNNCTSLGYGCGVHIICGVEETCGMCTLPAICNASGQCVCTPNCTGKTCGDNGCGGSCGTCSSGYTCQNGSCVAPPENIIYINSCQDLNQLNTTYYLTKDLSGAEVTEKCLNIQANNIILDCQGYSITGNEITGIYSNQTYTAIRNCMVSMHPTNGIGIKLENADNSELNNNVLNIQGTGISLTETSNAIIKDNEVSHNYGSNIVLIKSTNNQIINNNVSYSAEGKGIWLYDNSNYNLLKGNTFNYNKVNGGIGLYKSKYNEIIENVIIGNEEYGIWLWLSDNNIMINNFVKDTLITYGGFPGRGIYIRSSNNNEIKCGSFINNGDDIFVLRADSGYTCKNNSYYGNLGIDIVVSSGELFKNDYNCSSYCTWTGDTCIEQYCTDSDGGLNYYVKGYLNTSVSPGTVFEDYCLNNISLIERHCLSSDPYNFTVQYNCPNGCQNGACVNETTPKDPYLIEEDIGVLKYNQTIVNNNCEVLNNVSCENHKAVYYPNASGIESVEAIVEFPEIELTNEELENYILNAYSEWAEKYWLETWNGEQNVYLFFKQESNSLVNYIIAWHSDNKIILNKLNNWNFSEFDDDYLELFIESYLIKHASDIISEEDRCYWLDNSIRIKIDELEASGEIVVLREGDSVFEKEFFVISKNNGRVLELRDLTNDEGYNNDNINLQDAISGENFSFYAESEGVIRFILDGYEYTAKYYNEYYIEVTWPPEKIIETFYNCPYSREPVYIVIPEGASQEEWDFAWGLNGWIYQNSQLFYGNVIENQYVYKGNLDYYVHVGIKNNRALIVVGVNSPVSHYAFAIDFQNYLSSLVELGTLSSVCPIIKSDELTNKDIMESFCIEEGSCESCGIIGPFFCSEEACLNLSEGCYFVDVPFGPNECNSCFGFICADMLEESDCYSRTCNLECKWENNQCIEKQPLNVQLSFSTEKDSYAVNEIIKLTTPES